LPVRDDDSDEYLDRVRSAQSNLIDRTFQAGGTCTGEHGVGYGKIKYLERQYGRGAVAAMQLIKLSLDPHLIMNPGKVVIVN
jgi:D-lactate dehydrogenase (cytochrome)